MFKKLFMPIAWVLAFQGVSGLIGFFTASNMDWYKGLNQPELTPPDIAFPIVWTVLYVMLAICGWIVWSKRGEEGLRSVFYLYWLQMMLNWGWSFVFFVGQLVAIGFFWIVLLNLAMLAFIIVSWKRDCVAALLVVPTFLWCGFAAYLNYMIWVMN